MARKSSKPVLIKTARKKKVLLAEPVANSKPEGTDWIPATWDKLWDLVYAKALPYIVEYVKAQHEQAA